VRLEGEVALVTGASRGIGRAIAHSLGANGAVVIATATTAEGADAITKELAQRGVRGAGMPLEVTRRESVTALMARIDEQFEAVTILVNNAGVNRDNLLLRMKDEDWETILDTDLSSVYRLCKACLRGMLRARCGRIVNISSVVGLVGNPGQSNYAAAKAGIIGFSKSLAREVAARGITVNTIAPGFIDTDMTQAMSDEQRASLLQHIPLGRLGAPADVAEAVLFLASPAAAYITGETLNVNGGMHMP
jgi:3-oxoacyl-[acyl-carrier protein] reductase